VTGSRSGRVRHAWLLLVGVTFALSAAAGLRRALGVFIKPMETELGWDRTALLSHQIGSATDSMAGGLLDDRFGDDTVAFHSAAFVAFAATLMVWAIREHPVSRRPAPTVAVAPAGGA